MLGAEKTNPKQQEGSPASHLRPKEKKKSSFFAPSTPLFLVRHMSGRIWQVVDVAKNQSFRVKYLSAYFFGSHYNICQFYTCDCGAEARVCEHKKEVIRAISSIRNFFQKKEVRKHRALLAELA